MARSLAELRDIEAEAAVAASVIAHPDYALQSDFLTANQFTDKITGAIYGAVCGLQRKGIDRIDGVNVLNEIKADTSLSSMFPKERLDTGYIQTYLDRSIVAARQTTEEYRLAVNNVTSMAYKRELYRKSTDVLNSCFDPKMDKSKLDLYVSKEMLGLSEKYIVDTEINKFGDVIDDLWQETVDRRTPDGSFGLPSVIPLLNDYMTYEPGELVVIAGRMKEGKSAFMMNEAIDKLKRDVPTLYIDTEMQDRLFMERMLANLTGLTVHQIKSGNYDKDGADRIKQALAWIKKKPFVHLYMPSVTMDGVYAINKSLKYKMDLQFSIYDYIKSDVSETGVNYNVLGYMTNFLKNRIAGEMKLAVLAGVQLNREMRVADSDKIERYCSTSIYWRVKTREELQRDTLQCGNMALRVKVNRNGDGMSEDEYISINFFKDRMRIRQATQPDKPASPFA